MLDSWLLPIMVASNQFSILELDKLICQSLADVAAAEIERNGRRTVDIAELGRKSRKRRQEGLVTSKKALPAPKENEITNLCSRSDFD